MCTLFKCGKYATAIRSFKRVHAHFRNDYALTAGFSLPPQFYETLFKQPFPRTTFSMYKKQRIDEIAFLLLSSPRSIIRYILRINKYLLYDNDHCIRPLPKLRYINCRTICSNLVTSYCILVIRIQTLLRKLI